MAQPAQIRVLVGEDQPIVREGIVRVLEDSGLEVVGTAADARDLVRKARADRPDVVITDIQMPPDHTANGLRAAVPGHGTTPAALLACTTASGAQWNHAHIGLAEGG